MIITYECNETIGSSQFTPCVQDLYVNADTKQYEVFVLHRHIRIMDFSKLDLIVLPTGVANHTNSLFPHKHQ